MIQLFTQSRMTEGLSANENSQAVKINLSDHQNENSFGKQLSDVLQKFMGSGEQGGNKSKEHSKAPDGNQFVSDDTPLIHTVTDAGTKEEQQIQIRLVSDKQFKMEEHPGKSEVPEKFSAAEKTSSNFQTIANDSSDGITLGKILKDLRPVNLVQKSDVQKPQNDSGNLVQKNSAVAEATEIKSTGVKQNTQMKNTGIDPKEIFTGNSNSSHHTAETADSSGFKEGVIRQAAAHSESSQSKGGFKMSAVFEGLKKQSDQNQEKTTSVNSRTVNESGKENNRMLNSGTDKPFRDLMNNQAAGITVSKETISAAEKKSKNSDSSQLSKPKGEGERESLKSTERIDFQQTEKTVYSKSRSGQKVNTLSGFEPVLPQADNADAAESKSIGEIFKSESNDKKTGKNLEPIALKPDQSVVFQQAERRDLSVRLAKMIKQELQSGKAQGQGWKKHQFTLDDGTKVQLSLRKTEGVIQLQLGSVNSELNKLIQQHAQEIRQHLEEQMNTEVNLQFQESASENENGLMSDEKTGSEHRGENNQGRITNSAEKQVQHEGNRTRLFGFNNNEWTA